MAQLTLSQRGQMSTDSLFIQRLTAALKKTATYWKNFTGADNNTATYKRKIFAEQILKGSLPDMVAYVQYFLSQYNTDPAVMDSDIPSQLADSELTDSAATPATYDYFSEVETKDI